MAHSDGFTMIELVVVTTIIGLLLALAMPIFAASRRTATGDQLQATARQYADAIDEYRRDHGGRPPVLGDASQWPLATADMGPLRSLDGRPYLRPGGEQFHGLTPATTTTIAFIAAPGGPPATGAAIVYSRVDGNWNLDPVGTQFELAMYLDARLLCTITRDPAKPKEQRCL